MNSTGTGATEAETAEEPQIRAALDRHWTASARGDLEAEHEIYQDDVTCDYPQSGERIHGRRNLQALRGHHPAKPAGFEVLRLLGCGALWVTEYIITYTDGPVYTVSIMEFRGGKVAHETQYFAEPFEAPAWRAQWVEQTRG
ncbi:MAG: hypothetical protein JWR69_486 [Pedosphaera sp.]|nr:hypothetical protein [Pedosphaera sp.]